MFVLNENRVAGYESGLEIYEARLVLVCFCVGVVPNSPKFKLFLFVPSDDRSAAKVAAKNLAREGFHGSGGGCLKDTLGVSLSPAGFEKSSQQGCLTRSGACA